MGERSWPPGLDTTPTTKLERFKSGRQSMLATTGNEFYICTEIADSGNPIPGRVAQTEDEWERRKCNTKQEIVMHVCVVTPSLGIQS
jgi:hypothetical protein